jgi:hypothetical protein
MQVWQSLLLPWKPNAVLLFLLKLIALVLLSVTIGPECGAVSVDITVLSAGPVLLSFGDKDVSRLIQGYSAKLSFPGVHELSVK